MNENIRNQENHFRKKFIIGAVAVAVICLAACAAVLIFTGVKQNHYASAVQKGNQFYKAGDYQNAIVAYENAIAIDEKKETAYLNLSSVYIVTGDYAQAQETVSRGLQYLVSENLEGKKTEIQYLIDNKTKEEALTPEQLIQYAKDVAIENNMFDMFASYSYTEYYRDFGNITPMKSEGKVVFDYPSMGFSIAFYDLENTRIIDAATGMPYANEKPCEISFHNMRSLFASGADKFVVTYAKLQELFGSSLKFHKDERSGMYYVTAEYKKCKISVETNQDGNIISENAWNKIEPLVRGKFESEEEVDGEVKGYIQNAVSGKGMKATLKVRQRGKKNGTPIDELTSGSDGSYTYGGKQGSYTMEVSAKGFITEYLDVDIIRGQVKTGKNMVLSPEVGEGEIRIVLTWGSSPSDLDSYAIGKSSSGINFNINFRSKSFNNIGNLDVDDTTGYGPETITITDVGAEFTYSVADYRAVGSMGSSNAKVKVYLPGEKSAKEFNIPTGEGVLWHVFEYKNGEIRKINELTNEVSSKFSVGGR